MAFAIVRLEGMLQELNNALDHQHPGCQHDDQDDELATRLFPDRDRPTYHMDDLITEGMDEEARNQKG